MEKEMRGQGRDFRDTAIKKRVQKEDGGTRRGNVPRRAEWHRVGPFEHPSHR